MQPKAGQPKTAEGESWRTTPYQIACKVVSKGWADGLVISKVDGVLWDLDRVLEGDCKVEFLKFDNEEGKRIDLMRSSLVDSQFNANLSSPS